MGMTFVVGRNAGDLLRCQVRPFGEVHTAAELGVSVGWLPMTTNPWVVAYALTKSELAVSLVWGSRGFAGSGGAENVVGGSEYTTFHVVPLSDEYQMVAFCDAFPTATVPSGPLTIFEITAPGIPGERVQVMGGRVVGTATCDASSLPSSDCRTETTKPETAMTSAVTMLAWMVLRRVRRRFTRACSPEKSKSGASLRTAAWTRASVSSITTHPPVRQPQIQAVHEHASDLDESVLSPCQVHTPSRQRSHRPTGRRGSEARSLPVDDREVPRYS